MSSKDWQKPGLQQDTFINLDKDKTGQREMTFTKTISIFMTNGNLGLDSFSKCTRQTQGENQLLRNNNTEASGESTLAPF